MAFLGACLERRAWVASHDSRSEENRCCEWVSGVQTPERICKFDFAVRHDSLEPQLANLSSWSWLGPSLRQRRWADYHPYNVASLVPFSYNRHVGISYSPRRLVGVSNISV